MMRVVSKDRGKLRVALITSDYPSQRTSAAVQMSDLAQEMLRQGVEPIVLVPTVDLGATWKTEEREGVTVLYLNALRTRDTSYLQRTLGELLLPFVMLRGLRRSPYRDTRWDLVAWYSPTIFFGPLVWALKRASGCRAYLILRDIFPEWAVDLGLLRKGPVYAFFKAVARFQYSMADTIGVQTPSNLVYLEAWSRQPGRQLEVLQNWQTPAVDIGSSIQVKDSSLAGRKIFVYIGNMGVAQGMDIMIELAESLSHREDLGFLFVGRGSEVPRLKERVAQGQLSNTLFFDEVDSQEMPGLLAQCHVGLLALDPRHKSHNVPGKFLTYLLAGLPVLARVNAGTDLEQLIVSNGIGKVYAGDSVTDFVNLAEELVAPSFDYEETSTRAGVLASSMFSTTTAVNQIINTV